MSTSFAGLNLTQRDFARGAATLLACLSAFSGGNAVFQRTYYADLFGLPSSSPLYDLSSRNVFIAAAGASRLAGAFGLLSCLYFRQDKAVGLLLLTGSFVAVVDGLALQAEVEEIKRATVVELDAGTRKSLKAAHQHGFGHVIFGPVALALGAWLFHVSS